VLIVVNARDNNTDQQQTPPTVTDTVTPSPGASEAPPAAPSSWTQDQVTGNPASPASYEILR
jgi:hypothetical protein